MKKRFMAVSKGLCSSALIASMCVMNCIPVHAENVVGDTSGKQVTNLADGAKSVSNLGIPDWTKKYSVNPNISTRDNTGKVKYWYAGNAFYSLNQMSDSADGNKSIPFHYYLTGDESGAGTDVLQGIPNSDGQSLSVTLRSSVTPLYTSSQKYRFKENLGVCRYRREVGRQRYKYSGEGL